MPRLRIYLRKCLGFFSTRRADDELAEELHEHLALLEMDLQARGLSAEQAHRQARVALRQATTTQAVHDQRIFLSLERVWQDVRSSIRSLRRAPVFASASVLTLAIGIGATTTVFSVVNVSLLRPLPYPDSDRLVKLAAGGRTSFSGQEVHALKDRLRTVRSMAWSGGSRTWNLDVGGRATSVIGGRVSAGYFDALGVRPRLGRPFTASEDAEGGPPVIILSDRVWRSALHARSDVLGTTVHLGGSAYELVGVMPPGFRTFPDVSLWSPLRLTVTDNGRNHEVIARLHDDATVDQARAELATLGSTLGAEFGWSAEQVSRLTWLDYRQAIGQEYRPILVILLAAVGGVLLVACVNVAGLQLVRGTMRRVEIATRAAIGGGPHRLMMESLTESLLLSGAGAVLGLIGSMWALPRVTTLLPPRLLDGQTPTLDPTVLAVVLAAATGTGLLFGYLPARAARGVDVRTAMGTAGRQTAAAGTLRWRRVLAIGQIACALTLLVGAGLLGRTLLNFYRVDLGINPAGLSIGQMSLAGTPAPGGLSVPDFYERTLDRVRAMPGVLSAAVTSSPPVHRAINLPIAPPAGSRIPETRAVDWRYVSSGFFEMLEVPLLDGRLFATTDTGLSPSVVIVNQTFARAYFGDEPAIGRRVRIPFGLPDEQYDMEIIGVVGDIRNASGAGWGQSGHALKQAPAPGLFVPVVQAPSPLLAGLDPHWLIRSQMAPAALAAGVADVVQSAEPRLPLVSFATLDAVIGNHIAQERALFALLAVFAGIALLLACIGTYGLMAYSVSARSREVGIRMALGATAPRVVAHFLHEGLVVVLVGAAVGLIGAVVVARGVSAFVWGLAPFDPATFSAIVFMVGGIVMLAVAVPALRAARVSPARVLRGD